MECAELTGLVRLAGSALIGW